MPLAPNAPLSIVTTSPLTCSLPSCTCDIHSPISSDSPNPTASLFSLTDLTASSSNASSVASTPPPCERMDSPTLPTKTLLDDVAEDPSEVEDSTDEEVAVRAPSFSCVDENDFYTMWNQETESRSSCDYWDLSDGLRSESEIQLDSLKTHRISGDIICPPPLTTFKTRIAQRMPSLSRKPRNMRSYSSLSFAAPRSAPSSRSGSVRRRASSLTKPLATPPTIVDESIPVPALPTDFSTPSPQPTEIALIKPEDPIDRKALASTPLLPPSMLERKNSDNSVIQSPLQSPSIAETPAFFSQASTTPLANVQSPLLSPKASTVSFAATRDSHPQSQSCTDLTAPSDYFGECPADEWSDRLGHANFEIYPAPLAPVDCTFHDCVRLVADWESARRQYLSHAAIVSEDYGPTSTTLNLTEQKWASIDAQWKQIHDQTMARAQASGVNVEAVPRLADHVALTKIPTIDGPEGGKPMTLADNGQIVGPMVTYVSRVKPQSKKNAFMRFFSDLRAA